MSGLWTLLDGRTFLEAPRWHQGALYVSDIYASEVLRVADDGASEVVARVDGQPAGLGWLPDGRMLVVSMADRRLVCPGDDDDELTVYAELGQLAHNEINDLVVAATGHAFVSQFGSDLMAGEELKPAPLLRVDPDGSVHEAARDLSFANGMAITTDGSTLVVAESAGARLTAFTLAVDGTLSDRRIWANLPEGDFPDGICIDGEDAIWMASPMAQRFLRVRDGGAITDVVDTPGRHAIACELGGGDGRTLFCCTSPTMGDAGESRALSDAKVETVTVAVPAAKYEGRQS